jgi:hypothetical protein
MRTGHAVPPLPRGWSRGGHVLLAACLLLLASAYTLGQETDFAAPGDTSEAASSPDSSAAPQDSKEPPRPTAQATSKEGFTLGFTVHILEGNKVRLDVITDIPGTIEVMAGISLAGQAPNDVWIGVNDRARLTDGVGAATFDVSELPQGLYEAEVSYYPKWGPQDDVARASGANNEIDAFVAFRLTGSGESAQAAKFREEGQRWVMLNVEVGERWNPGFWEGKFGSMKELTVDRYNPDIIKAYYFESIDMTLIVNVLKGQIDTWRIGKAHH